MALPYITYFFAGAKQFRRASGMKKSDISARPDDRFSYMEQIENAFDRSFAVEKIKCLRFIRQAQSFARSRAGEQASQTLLLFNLAARPQTKYFPEVIGQKTFRLLRQIEAKILDQSRQQAQPHLGALFNQRIQNRH